MNSTSHNLAYMIQITFRTSPTEPDIVQLELIKAELQKIVNQGRIPTISEWVEIVSSICPTAGHHKYAGVDSSDLETLLQLATNKPGE